MENCFKDWVHCYVVWKWKDRFSIFFILVSWPLQVTSIICVLEPADGTKFYKPYKIMSYSSCKLFRMWIMKSLSVMLSFISNLVIQILSPPKFKIHSSGSFSMDSNLLLCNALFNFNRDKALCGAYLFSSMSQARLETQDFLHCKSIQMQLCKQMIGIDYQNQIIWS